MNVNPELFMKCVEDNAKNNERLAIAIENLTKEVKVVHEKYRKFSTKMVIVEVEMAFLIMLGVGGLFTLIQMLAKL